jgi:signal transduction histidine kinase
MSVKHWNHLKILRVGGLATWALVGLSLVLRSVDSDRPIPPEDLWKLWLSFAAFGYTYWWIASERIASDLQQLLALLVLSIMPVLIIHWTKSGIGVLLLIIAAGILPWYRDAPTAFGWVIVQSFLNLPVFLASGRYSIGEALLQCGLYLGCSGFSYMISWIGRGQSEAREALRRANGELRATQSLLVEGERAAERLRISRDLHDVVGHHLTALSLNLEVANHLCEGKARQHVQTALQISKLLLSDVRDVVSQLRHADGIDLAAAVQSLVEGVPSPQVHIELPERFTVHDPARAQVVLRLTQEILTNTIRHARARNLWIRYELDGPAVRLIARDDGCGAPADLRRGNGLSGMGERLAQFGGQLVIDTAPGLGFSLTARVPLEAA